MMPPLTLPYEIKELIDNCKDEEKICFSCPIFQYLFEKHLKTFDISAEILERIAISERHARCLCLMLSNFNSVLSKEKITLHVWGHINVSVASVPVLIFELRSLLQSSNLEIINSRGKGYAIVQARGQ